MNAVAAVIQPLSTPFSRHGVEHLSPSSLNMFVASPAIWVMERLLKKRAPVGAAAHRGTAVEAGVVHGLMDHTAPLEDCVAIAEKRFRELTALSRDPRREKEQDGIPGTVEQAIAEMRPWGVPSATQGKIEWRVDGLPVPIIGFYDLFYEQHGRIVDLKTQHALTSSIKTPHARQVALYQAASGDNLAAGLLYVTPKKRHVLTLENHREHLAALERIARCVGRFLAISDDPHELAGLMMPDTDSFYLNDPTARQHAWEVFGI